MQSVLQFTAQQFGRAIVMPNLFEPITSTSRAEVYREAIMEAIGDLKIKSKFEPLMTLYLTDDTDIKDLREGYKKGTLFGCKLYPANSTTNSSRGVTNISNILPVVEEMQSIGMPLLIHGEVTDPDVDIFDKEAVFIENVLVGLVKDFPSLKIVLEHITTSEAAEFVKSQNGKLGATITPHHLIIDRNAIFDGGIRPHNYCLPIAKRKENREKLREVATSGKSCFFGGTDSAPHTITMKETSCGCAGIFSAMNALELYLQVFEEEGAINNFEKFMSINGSQFYGLETNSETINLVKQTNQIPEMLEISDGSCVHPFLAGEKLNWKAEV